MELWRETLLRDLAEYEARSEFELEREMALLFAEFANEHADGLLRSCRPGHFTASAWVVDEAATRTLLTHHRKLDKWLQLGGHADGDGDLRAVALRETNEESGLRRIRLGQETVYDLDRHWIPARAGEPGHWHYDVRFLVIADPGEPLAITSESKDLAWVELGRVPELNREESLGRLARKTPRLSGRV